MSVYYAKIPSEGHAASGAYAARKLSFRAVNLNTIPIYATVHILPLFLSNASLLHLYFGNSDNVHCGYWPNPGQLMSSWVERKP